MTAREDILARIQTALGPAVSDPTATHARIARNYAKTSSLSREACLALFLDRLADYDTEIFEVTTEAELPAAIARALHHADESRVLIPPAFPAAWLPADTAFIIDDNLSTAEIEGVPAVITTCEAAVASTGTLVLVHRGTQGRRILTLLPDHHICIVRREQVYQLLPEALAAISNSEHLPITTISGPSATSDIEMTRVRGVHGPRRLTVILYAAICMPQIDEFIVVPQTLSS